MRLTSGSGAVDEIITVGAGNSPKGRALAVDDNGDIYLGGYAAQGADLGGGPLEGGRSHVGFLVKLLADGSHVWSTRFCTERATDSGNLNTINALSAGPVGVLALTGVDDTVEFGVARLSAGEGSALLQLD